MSSITKFADRAKLANALAEIALSDSHQSVAFSGGGTPRLLLETLAKRGFNKPSALVDDRLVPITHADSNRGMLRETLGVEVEELTAQSTSTADLVLLGLGGDGHTASLFPGRPETDSAFSSDAPDYMSSRPNADDGNVQIDRISMSANPIRRAARVILHIEGAAKLETFERVATDPTMPLGRVNLDPEINLEVYWAP